MCVRASRTGGGRRERCALAQARSASRACRSGPRAGWTAGGIDLSRAIRFPATGWRDASGKLDRDKLGKALAALASRQSLTAQKLLAQLS